MANIRRAHLVAVVAVSVLGILTPSGTAVAASPILSVSDTSAVEGNELNGPAVFHVRLSIRSATAVSASYVVSSQPGDTATPGEDYVRRRGTVTLLPGQTAKGIYIDTKGDRVVERRETFSISMTGLVGAAPGRTTAKATIVDDDPVADASLGISSPDFVEGDDGNGTLVFTVRLAAPQPVAVSADYATVDGTATAGSDYKAESGRLSIPAGARSARISMRVLADTRVEGNETFRVRLSAASGALISRATGVGTITDDD